MGEYRIYQLRHDARIEGPPTVLDALDDGEALREAQVLVRTAQVEVWEGARLVGSISPGSRR